MLASMQSSGGKGDAMVSFRHGKSRVNDVVDKGQGSDACFFLTLQVYH